MNNLIQKQYLATDYLRLLGDVKHIAQITQFKHARRALDLFLKQEEQQFDAGIRNQAQQKRQQKNTEENMADEQGVFCGRAESQGSAIFFQRSGIVNARPTARSQSR